MKEIKEHVKRWIRNNKYQLKGKEVVDVPAGTGLSSLEFLLCGSNIKAFDLFPEFFKTPGVSCSPLDLTKDIFPLSNNSQDIVLCQEGIEHFPDVYNVLKEFNRILKLDGKLILTTPNGSNLRARTSYFVSESEYFKMMPPNEIESIWMNHKNSKRIYFGHVFIQGIQRIRLFAKLAGFKISKIHFTHLGFTDFVLFVLFYPVLCLIGLFAFLRARAKNRANASTVFTEQLSLLLNPKVLLSRHLFLELTKVSEVDSVSNQLSSVLKNCDQVT